MFLPTTVPGVEQLKITILFDLLIQGGLTYAEVTTPSFGRQSHWNGIAKGQDHFEDGNDGTIEEYSSFFHGSTFLILKAFSINRFPLMEEGFVLTSTFSTWQIMNVM
uniref:Uncharacterized protein n=1 Tax=Lygus hesperus TaxID=30085 RepID=A0A146L8E0_LYGHE